jgi:hypothetical protein
MRLHIAAQTGAKETRSKWRVPQYPTIIQEYNICFTTVQPAVKQETADGEAAKRFNMPDKDGAQGVLPKVIKTLVDRCALVDPCMRPSQLQTFCAQTFLATPRCSCCSAAVAYPSDTCSSGSKFSCVL